MTWRLSFKKIALLALAAATALSACTSNPDQITAASVATAPYQAMSCNQLTVEQNRIVESLNTLNAAQKKKASNDAVAMGVGMVLFWPALFVLAAGSDQEESLAQAKGQYEAIKATREAKGC